MVNGKQLSSDIKTELLANMKLENGTQNIYEQLNVSKSTIQSIIFEKYEEFGSTVNLPRSGRPRKITTRMV